MRIFFLLLVLSFQPSCAYNKCDLCGRWQSDEKKTLADIGTNTPDIAKKLAASELATGFFGQAIYVMKENQFRFYFLDSNARMDGWGLYEIQQRNGNLLTVRFSHESIGGDVTYPVRLYDNCFAIDSSSGFHEHFCRIPDDD